MATQSHRREYRGARGYSIYVGPNHVRYIVGGQKNNNTCSMHVMSDPRAESETTCIAPFGPYITINRFVLCYYY